MKIILVFFLLITSSLYSNTLEKVSLQLKWKYQFQFAGFIMAKEMGFYEELGLDVQLKEFNKDVHIINDIKSGKIDFAVSNSSLINEALKGEPITALLAIFQHSPLILMGLKSSKIQTVHDIQGKKLALYSGGDTIAIKSMLKSNNIRYIGKAPVFTLDKLISGEIDLMTAYISNEPYTAKMNHIDVITFSPKEYGFEGYGDIFFTSKHMMRSNPELVDKMYKATKKGWEYAFSHIDETISLLYNKYNTLNKTKDALKFEADTLKVLSGYGNNLGELNENKVKGIGQLFNLMNNENRKLKILDDFIYKGPQSSSIHLTQEEKEYIKTKITMNVCAHERMKPFVIFDEKVPQGISVEFLSRISEKTNLKFNIKKNNSHKESLEMVKDGLCDITAMIVAKPNNFDFLIPTDILGKDYIVLTTKINEPYLTNLETLNDKIIGINKGSINLQKYVKHIYPNINLVKVGSDYLEKVANGELYGYIGSSYQLSYYISTKYFNTLKIMSKIGDLRIGGSFGVTTREPLLVDIINKALKTIPLNERKNILNKWQSVKIEKELDYTLLWQTIGFFSIFILILLWSNFKQKRLHKQIKELHDSLEVRVHEEVEKNKIQQLYILQQSRFVQMGEMISMIAHQWRQPLSAISTTSSILQLKAQNNTIDKDIVLDKSKKISNYVHHLSKTIDDFRNFFKPNKNIVKTSYNDLIESLLNIIEISIKVNQIELVLELQDTETFETYDNEVRQVILNIVKNAEDILLEKKTKTPYIKIKTYKYQNKHILEISDNGGGIPDDIIDKVFDAYFSTKLERNGTGLGLYMSKTIIEEHTNGTLSVVNGKDGAVFKITLPSSVKESR